MRRKEKYIFNGVVIGAGVTALIDIIGQWQNHRKREQAFTWQSYDAGQTLRNATIGGIIGGGISYLSYKYKIIEEQNIPFNSDEYLQKILMDEQLKSDPIFLKNVMLYREKLKQWLADKFGSNLITLPEETGSFYKRTAIGSNYDLDIVLPFRRSSYNTLEEMYYNVYGVVKSEFGSKAIVTKQTKAIGITFQNSGNPVHFDIVPGREINNYIKDKDLNLYVKADWTWQRGSAFKTNVGIQRQITANKPEAREIIKLLKVYRDRNELPLPTLIIEQCVVAALSNSNFGVYSSTTENLLNSMDFISTSLANKRLIDIANSNNNLYDKLNNAEKNSISNQLKIDIVKVEENPNYIRDIFEC